MSPKLIKDPASFRVYKWDGVSASGVYGGVSTKLRSLTDSLDWHGIDSVDGMAWLTLDEILDEDMILRIQIGLKKLPSAQRWIPASEKLPKEDTDVLISYRYKEGEGDTSHVYIDITSYGDMYFGGRKVKEAKHWRPPFAYFTSNYEVVAWMPLPECYRGEKDGE